jgi:hypothetical protein
MLPIDKPMNPVRRKAFQTSDRPGRYHDFNTPKKDAVRIYEAVPISLVPVWMQGCLI